VTPPERRFKDDLICARVTRSEFAARLERFLNYSMDELLIVRKKPGTPAIDIVIVSCLIKMANRGDAYSFNVLMDRIIGKVPDRLEGEIRVPAFINFVPVAQATIREDPNKTLPAP